MSGARINNYTPSTTTLDSVIGSVDYGFTGMLAVSLTNYTSTTLPAVAAGSIAEVASDVFQFSTEEAISTASVASTAACDYYIKLVPSSSQCTAAFSTTAPTWRTDYQGYYQNSTSIERIIAECYFSGSDYTDKKIYYGLGIMKNQHVYGITEFIFSGSLSTTVSINMDGYVRELTSVSIGVNANTLFAPIITSYSILSTQIVLSLAKWSTVSYTAWACCSGVNY